MKRAIVLVLDSFGVGETADADQFGDTGANTLLHIAERCAAGEADIERKGPLTLPNLSKLGLGLAGETSCGTLAPGLTRDVAENAAYGCAAELSSGKDTPSGHWEIAGVPVLFDWGYFSDKTESFPQALIDAFVERTGVPGILGNCHASGTQILEDLGEEHMRTGKPICYTSADSVFQIACHEESFGLERLIEICEIARELCDDYNIGRIIARPFVGQDKNSFERTGNRRDFSVLPPAPTVLDKLVDAGGEVVSVGKIADIYAHQGITKKIKASGNDALFDATLEAVREAGDNSIVFSNFVDFDMVFGHRRNVAGYAKALEDFDARLPELLALMGEDDLLIITADHGCDPTWVGTEHTREHIPVLIHGKQLAGRDLGIRESFADIGQSLASYFNLPATDYGKSIFND